MNENIMLVITTALISGMLATIVTIIWQKNYETRKHKLRIFETLMSYRYLISSQESVNALNSIDIVFYKDVPVRQAYKEFLNETSKLPGSGRDIDEKHLKLLEEIAKSIGYKNINWESIKHYYCPNGLMDNINKENELRELSIRSTRLYIERECMENDKGQP